MARAHFVKKARKDYPREGIDKGMSYWWWQFRHGPKRRSATRPRPSQLTSSDKKSRAFAAQEQVEDAVSEFRSADIVTADDFNDALTELRSVVEEATGELDEVATEYQESAEAIRDNFSESPTADLCDEQAEAVESYKDEIECVDLEPAWPKEDDEDLSDDEVASAVEDIVESIASDLEGADLAL